MVKLSKEDKMQRLKVSMLLDEFKPEVFKIKSDQTFYDLKQFYNFYNRALSSKFTEYLKINNLDLLAKFDLQNRSIFFLDFDQHQKFKFEFAILTKLRKTYNDSHFYTQKGFIFPKKEVEA